ncbi:MAG: YjgN family protein [Gammaproteobacteria bacterium]|nr:YjgN family protein [Gammaproteobacteria bacterium]MCW8923670.1 YjgN family protein [Gammaproteobacteria bacterium]
MEILQKEREIGFEFNGKASEYFKIWIVNVALSIVTLGIYSAWAKVRTKRYFYGNTTLDGSNFEYHANPVNILKGRLIVVAVIAVYMLTTQFMPMLEAAFFIVYMIGLPWMIVKSMQFNTRNSSYRNIRFDFDGAMKEAAIIFIGIGLLTIVTLGLATPYFIKRFKQFSIDNSYYGTTPFSFSATTGDFYRLYLKAMIVPLIIAIIAIIAAIAIPAYQGYVTTPQTQYEMGQMTPEQQEQAEMQRQIDQITADAGLSNQAPSPEAEKYAEMAAMAATTVTVVIMVFYLLIGIYIQTRTANLVLSSTSLEGHKLSSTLRVRNMFYIHLTNIIAAIISLGLLIPWCKIRLMRYRMKNLSLITESDINRFIANEQNNVKATAGEFADAFDIDMGF